MTNSALPHRTVLGLLLFTLLFIAAHFAIPGISARAVGQNATDPFAQCINQGTEPLQCLDKLGDPYSWNPTETACRFVGEKVEAIIAAGGDAKWRDLFYNERCVRLGLPHSRTAAEPGDNIHPHARDSQCMREIMDASNCWDILGRHSKYPKLGQFACEYEIRALRTRRDALAPLFRPRSWRMSDSMLWPDAFTNERCWRLGLPHFELR